MNPTGCLSHCAHHARRADKRFLANMNPLALTMGDPAGIGGELSLKTWLALRHTGPVVRRPGRSRLDWNALPETSA